jgi:hypothetical protein
LTPAVLVSVRPASRHAFDTLIVDVVRVPAQAECQPR